MLARLPLSAAERAEAMPRLSGACVCTGASA